MRDIPSEEHGWCRALWLAVTLQALRDALATNTCSLHIPGWLTEAHAREAEQWLRSDPDGVLSWLGIDGGAVLDRARRHGLVRRQIRGRV